MLQAPIIPATSTPGDTSNFERYPPAPLEELPGVLRAAQARQYQVEIDSIERNPDPCTFQCVIRFLSSSILVLRVLALCVFAHRRYTILRHRWLPFPIILAQ